MTSVQGGPLLGVVAQVALLEAEKAHHEQIIQELSIQAAERAAIILDHERLLALRNDVGLLSEEYDPQSRRLAGNFPQAFSHVALVNSAFNLSRAAKPAEQRSQQPAQGEQERVS